MGKIKKLKDVELVGGTEQSDVYPITSTKAIYDENNKRLDNIIAELQKSADSSLETENKTIVGSINELKRLRDKGYLFKGVATPDTNPGVVKQKVFYIANGKGTYANFGGLIVDEDEVVLLTYDDSWKKLATGIASQAKLTELEKTTSIFSFVGKGLSGEYPAALTYKEYPCRKGHYYLIQINNLENWSVSELESFPSYSVFVIEKIVNGVTTLVENIHINQLSSIKGQYSFFMESNSLLKIGIRADEGNIIDFSILDISQFDSVVKISAGKNLVSPAFFKTGHYFGNIGQINDSPVGAYTPNFILIHPNKEYCLSAKSYIGEGAFYCCFYDDALRFISSVSTTYTKEKTFTSPANAAFIRLSVYTSALDDEIMLEEGNSRTDYEEYNPIMGYISGVFSAINSKVGIKIGKNILDKSWLSAPGRYLSDGSISDNGISKRVERYIEVDGSTDYVLSATSQMGESTYYIIYYDANKEFISSQVIGWVTSRAFTTPENCAYIRFGIYASVIENNVMLEKGQSRTAYEEYNPIAGYGISELLQKTTKIDNIISSEKVIVNDLAVPVYYEDHIASAIASVRSNISDIDMDGDSFIFLSDIHWESNAKHSPALIKRITQSLPIRDVIFGGDAFNGGDPSTMIGYLNDFGHRMALASKRFFSVFGNHDENRNDGGTGFLHDEFYSFLQRYADDYVEYGKRGYYYADNKTTKTRKIFLDTFHGSGERVGTAAEQLSWLNSVLSSTPKGYHIIVFMHIYYKGSEGTTPTIITDFVNDIANALDKHNANRQSNDAFVDAIFAGHLHFDFNTETTGGIPVILIDCDVASQTLSGNPNAVGTIGEQAFDIVTIDYTNKTIKCVRVGRGQNRTITY